MNAISDVKVLMDDFINLTVEDESKINGLTERLSEMSSYLNDNFRCTGFSHRNLFTELTRQVQYLNFESGSSFDHFHGRVASRAGLIKELIESCEEGVYRYTFNGVSYKRKPARAA